MLSGWRDGILAGEEYTRLARERNVLATRPSDVTNVTETEVSLNLAGSARDNDAEPDEGRSRGRLSDAFFVGGSARSGASNFGGNSESRRKYTPDLAGERTLSRNSAGNRGVHVEIPAKRSSSADSGRTRLPRIL